MKTFEEWWEQYSRNDFRRSDEIARDAWAEAVKSHQLLIDAARKAVPVISAVFETEDPHVIGTTSATVKRVEHNDDGSISVVIDHWPSAPAVPEQGNWIDAADALEAQAERIKQLEADAARYSFLRMPSNSWKAEYLLRNNWDKELDDAIDAAMKERGNETRRMADELESQHAPLPNS